MLVVLAVAMLLALDPAPVVPRVAVDEDGTRAVTVVAGPTDGLGGAVPTVDRLRDGDVLAVTVTAGVARAEGVVRQCTQTASGFDDCTNHFPVQFGDDGTARFQYRVDDPGGCDGTTSCVVVVGDAAGSRRAVVSTVFGGPAPPPPTVRLTSPGPYEPGQSVGVAVTALRPGAVVSAAFCGTSCGAAQRAVADAAGTATIAVTVGDRCRGCGVVVVSGARATLVPLRFVPPPAASYDIGRLVAGLSVAAVALLVAWRTIVVVDWRPPSEAEVDDPDVVGAG